MLQVRPLETAKDWKAFLALPREINSTDPAWISPLNIQVRDTLNPKKNPYFDHSKAKYWLAEEDGKVVGRIGAFIDENFNASQKSKLGLFGYFESVDRPDVAAALLRVVEAWSKESGMDAVMGPINLSTNNECGLLVEGFDRPPCVLMTHNPPYYSSLIEKYGYQKAKDLYAYFLDKDQEYSPLIFQLAERTAKKANVVYRQLDMKKFDQEVATIFDIYNDAWENNWGFVPMTPAELQHLAKELKPIVDPRLILFAEVDGEPVAFSVSLPDINYAIAKVPSGKLLPTGLIKLLWYLKGPGRKGMKTLRVVTLGVKKAYQPLGLGPMFYTHILKEFPKYGYTHAEASWILEDNLPMNKALHRMGAKRDKVYRLYEKRLSN